MNYMDVKHRDISKRTTVIVCSLVGSLHASVISLLHFLCSLQTWSLWKCWGADETDAQLPAGTEYSAMNIDHFLTETQTMIMTFCLTSCLVRPHTLICWLNMFELNESPSFEHEPLLFLCCRPVRGSCCSPPAGLLDFSLMLFHPHPLTSSLQN